MYPLPALAEFRFDRRRLLQPIPGADPGGESLRYEGTYDRIRELRTEDDAVLSRGVWTLPLRRAEWRDAAELCVDALEKRSKDLQIAVWLAEAWVHLHGFQGLASGLGVISGLCSEFWEHLYPRAADGDSVEYRMSPVEWLNEKLPPLLKLLPLTEPESDDVKRYSWNDWEIASRAPNARSSEDPTPAIFQQSAMLTPSRFYLALRSDLEAAELERGMLESVLQKCCGTSAPSLGAIAATLDVVGKLVTALLSERREVQPVPPEPEPSTQMAEAATLSESDTNRFTLSGAPIRSRAEAYQRLSEAAEYLASTEPHSPAPYLVRRAILWGGMKLEDLLSELVRDNSERAQISQLLNLHGRA